MAKGILFDKYSIYLYNEIMISEQDKSKIIDIGSRYNVRELFLFGSSTDPEKPGKDIDLAVASIAPQDFFNVSFGDWEKIPRLQAKTLVLFWYGAL